MTNRQQNTMSDSDERLLKGISAYVNNEDRACAECGHRAHRGCLDDGSIKCGDCCSCPDCGAESVGKTPRSGLLGFASDLVGGGR